MGTFFRITFKILRILAVVTGILFIVYFWNLDQKLMAWLYRVVNLIFDRKKEDLHF